MALVRMLVTYGLAAAKPEEKYSNTLYFNVSGSIEDPDYQALANDLRGIYATQAWMAGYKIEVRAYDMADAKPRPERAYATVTTTGTAISSPGQTAICLSYYADRNLPRRRGRIYTGPWTGTVSLVPSGTMANIIAFGQSLAGLGGVNVDWSVYSPTTAQGGDGGHWRISNIWVDNSWDVVRSRKIAATTRQAATING